MNACIPHTQVCKGEGSWNGADDISECGSHTECGAGMGVVGHSTTTAGSCVECEVWTYSPGKAAEPCRDGTEQPCVADSTNTGAVCECDAGFNDAEQACCFSLAAACLLLPPALSPAAPLLRLLLFVAISPRHLAHCALCSPPVAPSCTAWVGVAASHVG